MFIVFLFFIIMYILFSLLISLYRKQKLAELEMQFLTGSLEFHQYKYHLLQLLEVIYDKASEHDDSFREDYEKIKIKTEEKFNLIGDNLIKNLQKTLGNNTKYNSWQELIKEADKILSEQKKWTQKKK